MNYDNEMDDYYESPKFEETQRLERQFIQNEIEERMRNEARI